MGEQGNQVERSCCGHAYQNIESELDLQDPRVSRMLKAIELVSIVGPEREVPFYKQRGYLIKQCVPKLIALDDALEVHDGHEVLHLNSLGTDEPLYAQMVDARFVCAFPPDVIKRAHEGLTARLRAIKETYGCSDRVDCCIGVPVDLPFADNTFDRVYSVGRLSGTWGNMQQIYNEVFRVLRPGGRFVHFDLYREIAADGLGGYISHHHSIDYWRVLRDSRFMKHKLVHEPKAPPGLFAWNPHDSLEYLIAEK